MTVVFGLRTRLRVRMRTKLENGVLSNGMQERIMTSFFIAEASRVEEERVTDKNSKQAESPACTKNRTHLRTSSQFHDLRPHNVVLPS